MDLLDKKLLVELMQNSRLPLARLAKRVRASREVVTYRLNKLVKDGIILNFTTEIDTERLGFVAAAVFINVKAKRQQEFQEFLRNCSFVSWVVELSGLWSFAFSIFGKSNEELDEEFLGIYKKFKDDIIDHRFTLHRKTVFFYEKFLGAELKPLLTAKETKYDIDKKDKLILEELAKNARIECTALAKKVQLTAPAVSQRIKQLRQSGYICKHSIFMDVTKLGLFQYSIFVVNRNIDEKNRLVSYLGGRSNVSFVAEYVSDPFVELGLFVENPYDLRRILREIEQAFPYNRVIEISLFQKEFVSIGPPPCVFW